MLELKNELDKEPAQTKDTARKTVRGKAVALAEELQAYGLETIPMPETGVEGDGLRPWLNSLIQEDTTPYTSYASSLLKDLNEIEQNQATYLLENGERLSLVRDGEGVQYQIHTPDQQVLAEGLLAEPELLLDAAKDQTLSQSGRSEIQSERITERELEALSTLGASEPQVTFTRSELADIPPGMSLPLSQANRLMERLGQRQRNDHQRSNQNGSHIYSINFKVEYVQEGKPYIYSGRQEIGTGDGSLTHHIQAQLQSHLDDKSWQKYLLSKGDLNLAEDRQSLESLRDELLPYYNNHIALSYLSERTGQYQAGINSLAADKQVAMASYYQDIQSYVQNAREAMNLSSQYTSPEFPQLNQYLINSERSQVKEKDLDVDGSPDRVDIDDSDARMQLAHHYERRDGKEEKASIRERLRQANGKDESQQQEKRAAREMELDV
jgi:hypothetical protein